MDVLFERVAIEARCFGGVTSTDQREREYAHQRIQRIDETLPDCCLSQKLISGRQFSQLHRTTTTSVEEFFRLPENQYRTRIANLQVEVPLWIVEERKRAGLQLGEHFPAPAAASLVR